ncbi:CoA-binding protein [Halorubrum aidingense JCM 13560]|uniref:acetate--CoA ligase (ADP-forming) n=1 Tax=Halorubrum aidingense JCM 13560 TaxID=1230454 RepID=M0P4R4_9EURY|nr:acetate--CoA ligase family protein [Halorubrum aidingense]EMA65132.1 CoA-binding protein [Halorubrum aidingense JCM 13560]
MGTLNELFDPDRVAVVGATAREGAVGRAVTSNLLDDFDGDTVPVNPNYDEVLGTPCVDEVADANADVAVVVVPPSIVLDAIEACGAAGVRNVVVITAGFGETGEDGAARERRLAEIADEYDLNLVGPNSLGIMSTPSGMNATFGPENALPGGLSFMSQSGAFVTAVLDWANDNGIGFKDVVSLGNKAVLDETDFVDHWGDDDETDVIIGYLEGIEDGREFIDTARETSQDTPIVAVKSGRTSAGAQAASSHTGTLAGSDKAYEAGLDQAGVIRAESVDELFDAAGILGSQPLPDTDSVAIVTNAGGPGVMATDAVGDADLDMASFTSETSDALRDSMPEEANIHNPVDVIGDADVERFREALEITVADDNVGAALVLAAPTATIDFDDLADAIEAVSEEMDAPVAACLMGGDRTREPKQQLQARGIPCYFDPARGIESLATLAQYRDIKQREYDAPMSFDVDRERAREILGTVRDRDDNRLGVEAMELLDAYGIPTPAGEIVDSPERAAAVAADIDGDVVMKIVSPDILHKSDIGGVAVGVTDDDVADTYEDLITRARNYQPDATVLGVQVQEMVDLDNGVETIVGMNRDPQFGPLLMFGLGGIFVEVMEDTTFRVAPVSESEARTMTEEIQSAPLLRGARGRDPVDVDAVVETIGRLSQLVTDFPAILELDINPLVALPDDDGGTNAAAVDVRLTVDPEELEA